MERLRQRDLLAVLRVVRELYAPLDREGYRHTVLRELASITPSTVTTYNEVDTRLWRDMMIGVPPLDTLLAGWEPILNRHIGEHPIARYYHQTNDCRVLKISDFLTQRQFHHLGLHREFLRPMRVEYEMTVALAISPHMVVGLAVNRDGPDFTERERSILELLSPHLIQSYRAAEAVTRMREDLRLFLHAAEGAGRALIVLSRDRRVRLASPRASEILRRCWGRSSGDLLPEELARWIRYNRDTLAQPDEAPRPRRPLVVERDGKRLVAWLLTQPDGESLVILEEQITSCTPAMLHGLGLTRREAEVLFWLIQGKTDAEIAATLGTARRTVSKHLERIYPKLGVGTRTAAATRALERISSLGVRLEATPPPSAHRPPSRAQ